MRIMKFSLEKIILDLRELALAKCRYERSMQQALARRPFLKTDGQYLSRAEVHSRSGLR
jgi:hypothetical protein